MHRTTGRNRGRSRWCPRPEILKPRTLLSGSFVVTNTSDGGAGSLRQAILNADANNAAPVTISFQIPETDPGYANGVFTIQPASPLPVLARTPPSTGRPRSPSRGAPTPTAP